MDLELTNAFHSPLQLKSPLFQNIPIASLSPKRHIRVDNSEVICSPPVGTPIAVIEVVCEHYVGKNKKSSSLNNESANAKTWNRFAVSIIAFYFVMLAVSYQSEFINFTINEKDNYSIMTSIEGISNRFNRNGQPIQNNLAIYQSMDTSLNSPTPYVRTINNNQFVVKPAPNFSRRLKASLRMVSKGSLDMDFMEQALKLEKQSLNNTRTVYIIKPFTLRVTGKVSASFQTGFRGMTSRLLRHLKVCFQTILSELASSIFDHIKLLWAEYVVPTVEAKKMKIYSDVWFKQSRKMVKI